MPPVNAKNKEAKVLHPDPRIELRAGLEAITAAEAKLILGWTITEGDEFLTRDTANNKVACTNNLNNRCLYGTTIKTLVQEQLRQRWRFNGEPIIIGKTGKLLNGQHTLISLVLAEEYREMQPELYPWGDNPVTIDKTIVYGVDEDDATINTMDTCKPRSLTDVIFRSESFTGMKAPERRAASRVMDSAIKLVWFRTHAQMDAYSVQRTHAEAIDFFTRHGKLLDAVKHIITENGGSESRISKYLPLGVASGLLYLMACSGTSDDELKVYSDSRRESDLEFSRMDKACEFFVLFATSSQELKPLRYAIGKLGTGDIGGASVSEKVGTIVKAWTLFISGKKVTEDQLKLSYTKDDDDIYILTDYPMLGGPDKGERQDEEEEDDPELTEAQVEKAKAEAKTEKEKPKAPKPKKATVAPQEDDDEPKEPLDSQWRKIKDNHEDKILLFKSDKGYNIFSEDATLVGATLRMKVEKKEGVIALTLEKATAQARIAKLKEAGYVLGIVVKIGGEITVTTEKK